MYPKPPFPGSGGESPPAAKSTLRRSVGVAIAFTVLAACVSLPVYGAGVPGALASIEHSLTAFPLVSPQLAAGPADLLPDQPVVPQPEAVPPASVVAAVQLDPAVGIPGVSAATAAPQPGGAELADTGFHAIWLLPLAGGLILLGVLFAVFASRKQRRDEEQLVAEQAELARQAALAQLADRVALSELEELEKLDQAAARRLEESPPVAPTGPGDRVHPIEPRGPGERVGPFVSFPDDRVGPDFGADSHEENGKRPDAP